MKIIRCKTWAEVIKAIKTASKKLGADDGEILWFRGCRDARRQLIPTLMRDTAKLSDEHHDWAERDLFFEFQALAKELRERGLNDWEYLFYARHFGLPTRVLDWTDTFGVALYFAFEGPKKTGSAPEPAVFVINPYAMNEESIAEREITLPKYLGWNHDDNEFWEFGEMLAEGGDWPWDGPAAIYPIQLNERVRAQRGWFTIHGNSRLPIEEQMPRQVVKIIIEKSCHKDALHFLELSGFNQFSIYPDLDNLAAWIRDKNLLWAEKFGKPKAGTRSRKKLKNSRL
jgi:hypothetical protein